MRRFLLLAVVMLACGVAVWCWRQAFLPVPPAPPEGNAPTAAVPSLRDVAVYFAREMPDGRFVLTPVKRRFLETANLAEAALQALIEGPTLEEQAEGLRPTLPRGTRLIGVWMKHREGEGAVAVANWSRELQENFPGGSAWEEIVLYSIVNTLDSLEGVDAVRLQVEGSPTESIGGHLAADTLLHYNPDIVVLGKAR